MELACGSHHPPAEEEEEEEDEDFAVELAGLLAGDSGEDEKENRSQKRRRLVGREPVQHCVWVCESSRMWLFVYGRVQLCISSCGCQVW